MSEETPGLSGLRALFVMDPLSTVNVRLDTTFVLMREAQRRGHGVEMCLISELSRRRGRTHALARSVRLTGDEAAPFVVGEDAVRALDDYDVVFMRKDPPFNMEYIFATYQLDGTTSRVLNRPAGLREANEKCFIQRFPDVIPETLVTSRAEEIIAFVAEQGGRCIIKPLDGMGGLGVYLLRADDPNLTSLIETSTQFGRRYAMCQRYLPEAVEGDKRIILVDGEPVGATLRVPRKGELRGNIHVGAQCVKTELSAADRRICETVGPALRELGLFFVGIDVIGGYLTEVNVTSPTGAQEINALDGISVEGLTWDRIEGAEGR
jgi:glutathione synthase